MRSVDSIDGRAAWLQLNISVICWTMCFSATSAMMLPVLNTIWAACQLGYSQVTTLQGFFAIVVALGEVPGGVLADVFGFRRALITGHILAFIAATLLHSAQRFVVANDRYGFRCWPLHSCRWQ